MKPELLAALEADGSLRDWLERLEPAARDLIAEKDIYGEALLLAARMVATGSDLEAEVFAFAERSFGLEAGANPPPELEAEGYALWERLQAEEAEEDVLGILVAGQVDDLRWWQNLGDAEVPVIVAIGEETGAEALRARIREHLQTWARS